MDGKRALPKGIQWVPLLTQVAIEPPNSWLLCIVLSHIKKFEMATYRIGDGIESRQEDMVGEDFC